MSVVTLIDDDLLHVRAELLWFGTVLHADVKKRWTKSTRQVVRKSLGRIFEIVPQPALAFVCDGENKLRKFIKDMGGRRDHIRHTEDGRRVEMYRFHPLDISNGVLKIGKSL